MPKDSKKILHERTLHYLEGVLSESEAQAFAQDMRDDAYAEEVAAEIIRHQARLELKQKLQVIRAQSDKVRSQSVYLYPVRLAAAIILLLILPIGVSLWLEQNPSWGESLFSHSFEPYIATSLGHSFGHDSTTLSQWRHAMHYYEQEQYEQAIPLFQKLLEQDQKSAYKYHFYLGLSYLAHTPEQSDEAVDALEEVIAAEEDLVDQGKWYLALAYWNQGKKESAIKLFKEIASTDGAFKQAASQEIIANYYSK